MDPRFDHITTDRLKVEHRKKGPTWGLYLAAGDDDVIDASLLMAQARFRAAYYHGAQAVEKYIKAAILGAENVPYDPIDANRAKRARIKSHDVTNLLALAAGQGVQYAAGLGEQLVGISKLNETMRYPDSEGEPSVMDQERFTELFDRTVCELRGAFTIEHDRYPLAVVCAPRRNRFFDYQHTCLVASFPELANRIVRTLPS